MAKGDGFPGARPREKLDLERGVGAQLGGDNKLRRPAASPYVIVATGGDDLLAPGEAVTFVLENTNSNTTQSITYITRLLAGAVR